MVVLIRIFEEAPSRFIQGLITFTYGLDAFLPQVLECGIPGWKNRTSMLDLFVDKQEK